MKKKTNSKREAAFKIFKKSQGKLTSKEIAKLLDEKVSNINYWRRTDKWKQKYNPKGGAPLGNKNASGNNGGGQPNNQNARTYGWYSKYFPIKARNLIEEAEASGGSPLDILWAQIQTQWITIIRAQELMYVEDQDDMTKELKKYQVGKDGDTEEYEIQFAWDKHATFMNAQSRAMTTLTNMLKKYDDMIHANWDIATEEQRLRVERLKVQIDNPDLNHRKQVHKDKIGIERERFEHTKKMDEENSW